DTGQCDRVRAARGAATDHRRHSAGVRGPTRARTPCAYVLAPCRPLQARERARHRLGDRSERDAEDVRDLAIAEAAAPQIQAVPIALGQRVDDGGHATAMFAQPELSFGVLP